MSATTLSGFFEQWWFAIIGFPMMLAYMVFSYRRQAGKNEDSDEPALAPYPRHALISRIWFAVTVAALLWSSRYGMLVAGLGVAAWGVWCIVAWRIPDGVEGRQIILSGIVVVLMALMGLVVGGALMFIPEMFDPSLEIRTR